jgi:aminoglycoside phosphotransferase (APT) family kinase protein
VHEWSADVAVDQHLVRRLIASQFPEIELRALLLMAEGWDNSVWLVNGRWVFRFPRRAVAGAGVEREMAVLPRLAPMLPLPIPVPVFFGRPAEGYPWSFFGGALVPGCETADAALTDAERRRLAGPLASFLRVLHSSDVAARLNAARELPADPMGRGDMRRRVRLTLERLSEVEQQGLWRLPGSVRDWLEPARDLPPAAPSSVVHGDLHLRHLLVDERGAPAGVIDWGDLCRADPAIDLPLLWSLLPADARADFLAAYGPVSHEQLLRARVLAVFLCATLALYAHHERITKVEREAIASLARAAGDWP